MDLYRAMRSLIFHRLARRQPPQDTSSSPMARTTALVPHRRWDTLLNMAAFAAQRLMFGALVLLAIAFLSYLGLAMAQGEPLYPALSEAVWNTLAYFARLERVMDFGQV
jgi:hypothetical protein